MKFAVAAVAGVLVLAGCGGKEAPQATQTTTVTAPATTPAETPSETPTASVTPTPKAQDAGQIAAKMKAGVSAKSVKVWTEDNDPNELLGRPGQYTSAATLYDKSLPCTDPGVDCGATIEVFATADEAKKRAAYIASVRTGGILGTEYHTLIGSTLLRVTGELPPKTNRKYAAAFKAAMG